VIGAKIRMERLKLNYSQEGLCKDICTVSYLSKIEQGQVEAGENIVQLLFQKLHINFHMDEEFLKEAGKLIDNLYDEFYSFEDMKLLLQELKQKKEDYLNSPYLLDTLLFLELESQQEGEELNPYVTCMEQKQYEVYLYIQCLKGIDKSQDLLHLNPNAYYTTQLGIMRCQKGQYVEALELLLKGYELCANEGYAQSFLGNSYAGLNKNELMLRSYKVAARIAKSLKDDKFIRTINYNIGAALLEWNQVQQAKEYLEQCTDGSILFYQKYAICLEKLGDYEQAGKILQKGFLKLQQAIEAEEESEEKSKEEAIEESEEKTKEESEEKSKEESEEKTNDKSEEKSKEESVGESKKTLHAWKKMYEVVDYRLTHKDYINEDIYEELLYDCMTYLKEFLPVGYVKFHVPYYVEVLEKKRRYKDIYKLLKGFS